MISKRFQIVSFDIGNTLIKIDNNGFCSDFSIKTGHSVEELRPLFLKYFLTKNYTLKDAVYKVSKIIGYKTPQKLIDEYRPAPIHLFEDVIPVLQWLYNEGVTIIASSNCTPWEAGGIHTLDTNQYLKEIYYSFDIGAAKPDPANFLYVQNALGVSPKDILHVGDNYIADVQGALSVGWQAVLLDRNNKSTSHFHANSNIIRIKNLRELKNLL